MTLMKVSSLRLRLLVALMLAILAFWAAWFASQAMLMSSQQNGRWDASMQAVGQQILMSLPAAQPSGSSQPAYNLPAKIRLQPEMLSYQVWLNPGHAVMRSTGSPEAPWVPLQFDAPESFGQAVIDGVDWRVYTLSDAAGRIQVQVGKSQPQLLNLLSLWLGTSVGTVLLLMALLGGVTWFIICWSLGPVEDARAALLTRKPLDMGPLSEHKLPSEVRPLVQAFNALLLRLDAALKGERRFLADAAHELRTPLAVLMAQAQLVQSAGTLAESRSSVEPLIHGIERSARLTEQLLDLARLDAVESPDSRPIVAVHEIVSMIARDFNGMAQTSGQRLLLRAEPCHAPLDVDAVGVLLSNLLDNAVRYAGSGARIEIDCREQETDTGQCVLLSVRDDGPGVPLAERERILDRFYRVPGTPGRGSGIGLSLVARIAHIHSAELEMGEGLDGRGLSITLRFVTLHAAVEAGAPKLPQAWRMAPLSPRRAP